MRARAPALAPAQLAALVQRAGPRMRGDVVLALLVDYECAKARGLMVLPATLKAPSRVAALLHAELMAVLGTSFLVLNKNHVNCVPKKASFLSGS
mgnify:CR=1 FL=1